MQKSRLNNLLTQFGWDVSGFVLSQMALGDSPAKICAGLEERGVPPENCTQCIDAALQKDLAEKSKLTNRCMFLGGGGMAAIVLIAISVDALYISLHPHDNTRENVDTHQLAVSGHFHFRVYECSEKHVELVNTDSSRSFHSLPGAFPADAGPVPSNRFDGVPSLRRQAR